MSNVGRMPETDLLTTAEAAEALGCSVKTIARMVDDGRLTSRMKLPGLRGPYLFDPAEIERARLLDNSTENAPKAAAS